MSKKFLVGGHRPPRRLQGEAIRDSLLTLSGRLDTTAFGPPVPIHLTSFMNGRGRPKKSGSLDGDGRRSIYISVRRNFLSPFMLAFDTPTPFSSMECKNAALAVAAEPCEQGEPSCACRDRSGSRTVSPPRESQSAIW